MPLRSGRRSSIVVLSGGLDSTVCLAIARAGGNALLALTFDYGQRHRVELSRAAAIAHHYGAEPLVVDLDARRWGGSALTDDTIAIPEPSPPHGPSPVPSAAPSTPPEPGQPTASLAHELIPTTYVPARNLIFLSIAVAVAEARDADSVYLGVNALDYSGYPDCRPEFVRSFATTAALATRRGARGHPIAIVTPLAELSKAAIVRLGLELGAPLGLTWSCYRGGAEPCGHCDACGLRAKGFAEAGVADPALGRPGTADPRVGPPGTTDPPPGNREG